MDDELGLRSRPEGRDVRSELVDDARACRRQSLGRGDRAARPQLGRDVARLQRQHHHVRRAAVGRRLRVEDLLGVYAEVRDDRLDVDPEHQRAGAQQRQGRLDGEGSQEADLERLAAQVRRQLLGAGCDEAGRRLGRLETPQHLHIVERIVPGFAREVGIHRRAQTIDFVPHEPPSLPRTHSSGPARQCKTAAGRARSRRSAPCLSAITPPGSPA
jgi:hypothetical protein